MSKQTDLLDYLKAQDYDAASGESLRDHKHLQASTLRYKRLNDEDLADYS